jgi:hypothetical protein
MPKEKLFYFILCFKHFYDNPIKMTKEFFLSWHKTQFKLTKAVFFC